MERYLYKDLFVTEQKHWWHRAKTGTIFDYLRRFVTTPNAKILDVGCGTGNNVQKWSMIGDAYGVDPSADALRFCHKRGLTQVVKGDAEHLPFPAQTFDGITLLDVLEHIESEGQALNECARVLKKNGYLILSVPAFPFLWSTWDEVLHHKRRYTRKSLYEVLVKNGFSIREMTYRYSFLFIPAYVVRYVKSLLYKGKSYPSDFSHTNSLVNTLFSLLFWIESVWMRILPVPFGTTLFCVAQKRTV